MNSLTAFKKIMEKYGKTNTLEGTYDYFLAIKKDLEKLDQLEKIEKELGIDLITVFKALKNGFWAKSSTGIAFYKEDKEHTVFIRHLGYDIEICCEECKNEINAIPTMYLERSTKDYGKTWSLDKNDLTSEELENDK